MGNSMSSHHRRSTDAGPGKKGALVSVIRALSWSGAVSGAENQWLFHGSAVHSQLCVSRKACMHERQCAASRGLLRSGGARDKQQLR